LDKKSLPKGLRESLEPGEEVLYMVKKKFALEKPKWLIVSNRRIIFFDEKILGRYELKSVPFEKLERIIYHGGVVGSSFMIILENGEELKLSWTDKDESKKAISEIYSAVSKIAIERPLLDKKKNLLSEEWVFEKPSELVARSTRAAP
jgi:hypothetical protein